MHRLSALSCRAGLLAAAAALFAPLAAPLAAQAQPGPFTLPQSTPTPTPAPAGPADERAGVAIPPRAVQSPVPSPVPSVTPPPVIQPLPSPSPTRAPANRPASTPAPQDAAPAPVAAPDPDATAASDAVDAPPAPATAPPLMLPGADQAPAVPGSAGADLVTAGSEAAWWPYAAGALGALGLLIGGVWVWRRRQPAARRLAAPVPGRSASGLADAGVSAIPHDPAQLNLTLEIISATRSVMMFTVAYRLTIANRSDRAVNDLGAAVQLACARADAAGSAGNAPSPGAAQATDRIARIGPHQARSMTGELRLPLAAIQPLRQGKTPLFVPLAHVTLEGEGLPAMHRSFVIGTSSSAGRVHPIPLDQPPGGIAGLVARAISIAPASAPAPVAA